MERETRNEERQPSVRKERLQMREDSPVRGKRTRAEGRQPAVLGKRQEM